MRRRFLGMAAAVLMLLSARPVQAAVDSHVVSSVEILCKTGDRLIRREYRQERKMEAVLNYLRLAKYAGMPDASPPAGSDDLRVTVHLIPGGCRRYDLRDWQFLSRDGSPWELMEMPAGFVYLLERLPSDG